MTAARDRTRWGRRTGVPLAESMPTVPADASPWRDWMCRTRKTHRDVQPLPVAVQRQRRTKAVAAMLAPLAVVLVGHGRGTRPTPRHQWPRDAEAAYRRWMLRNDSGHDTTACGRCRSGGIDPVAYATADRILRLGGL